ncbi:MAG: ATP-dependent DNA helicase RecG [Patescibacteria group bacterium]|nr:ATP-dependent DNA helicase RecG [Patescibacteria group bacterium]MDD5490271.1 ATP-dependent DNA helicase RecG [Patescibacteria group bacterium]
MFVLATPVSHLTRVGRVTAKQLEKIGIETVEDLIFYYPFRYDDLSRVLTIDKLFPGVEATVRGRVELIKNRRSPVKKKILTEAIVSDDTGSLKVVWFNQPFLTKNIRPGDVIYLAGKANFDYREIEFVNPVYEIVRRGAPLNTAAIVPVYHLTGRITQKQLRFLIKHSLDFIGEVPEWLPKDIIKRRDFISITEALRQIHFPASWAEVEEAESRLKFDELFLFQLLAQRIKHLLKKSRAIPIEFKKRQTVKFVNSLPFKLTNDQRLAAWEIIKDLEGDRPMNRLLEGDVGSGKTVVAAMAMLNVVLNKHQAALMAATDILARQHYKTICKLLADFNIKIGLVTRSEKKINYKLGARNPVGGKKNFDSRFVTHNSDIIIGTHALISAKGAVPADRHGPASGGQDKIEFKNLALTIIDEQHRFGVEQRKFLKANSGQSGITPHFLSMTATPIPRSLALALYGDLDLSIIKEMPKGRKKILTKIVDSKNRSGAYEFIREKVKEGRQVFVICPLINPSDKLGVKSVAEEYQKLRKDIFPEFKIEALHGKLPSAAKEKIMTEFSENKINVLVSTSVVEVGIDVPNATIMMIEGAERFGLAQLHQFRGRVGRGEHQSYCLLFSDNLVGQTKERLRALVSSNDGFALAEKDLALRGPGEVYGTQQSGIIDLKLAKLTDFLIIKQAKEEAEKIIADDPEFKKYAEIKARLRLAEEAVHLE